MKSVLRMPGVLSLSGAGLMVGVALACSAAACGDDPTPGSGGAGGDAASASGSAGSSGASTATGSPTSGSGGGNGSGNGGGGGNGSGNGGGGGSGSGGGAPVSDCGNGAVEMGEACDDGNKVAGDYCAADCSSVTGSCGDGALQENETCDDASSMAGCDTTHDGGDGKCVPAGTCSPGYVLAMNQCEPELKTVHVHIMPDNFCNLTVDPSEFTVPAGQKLKLSYHNHSNNIPVDVWMHYGGGYTDLAPGGTWNEQYEHCFGPIASEGYADITACNTTFRLKIHCL